MTGQVQQPAARQGTGTGVWSAVFHDPRQGPLPALMLVLTVLTGIVDAVSILALGRVFVANMTGNVAFLGLALAGAPGFSSSSSVAALVGFLVGAFLGGRLVAGSGADRGRLLRSSCVVELVFLAAAFVVALAAPEMLGLGPRLAAAALLGAGMGIQNAAARSLAVPDLTTTVLTMTITGLGADTGPRAAATTRRVLAVLSLLGGAVVGGLVVLHSSTPYALAMALALLVVVLVSAHRTTRHSAAWQTYKA